MKKINSKKVLEAWKTILNNTPFEKYLPDGDVLPEGMLPISVNVANLINGHDLVATSEQEAVPVTHNSKIVGACIRGNVEFFDTPEAKAAIAYINNIDGQIGISSRKLGTIAPDGSIKEGPEFEQSIINLPKDE
jgi:hypothetical protein